MNILLLIISLCIDYQVLKNSLQDKLLAIAIVFEGLNGTVKALLWSDMAVTIDAL